MTMMFKVHAFARGAVEPDFTVSCETLPEALAVRSEHTGYGFIIKMERVCAVCGRTVPDGPYCDMCGARFDERLPEEPPEYWAMVERAAFREGRLPNLPRHPRRGSTTISVVP